MSDPRLPHQIGNTHDLTFELLLRLPVPSVLRFRTVSKLWLSISTSSHFLISHSRHRLAPTPSALLFHSNETYSPALLHAALPSQPTMPGPSLAFAEDDHGVRVIHSCNGLLLCYSNYKLSDGPNPALYILNPTFMSYKSIPYPKFKSLNKPRAELTLVFDPAEAPGFKLVCVWSSEKSLHSPRNMNLAFEMEVYTSENQTWRVLGEFCFKRTFIKQLAGGVFWHGAIHWLDSTAGPLCFDLETEQPRTIQPPHATKEDIFSTERFTYLGVCNDQLSLIEARYLNSQFLDFLQLKTHQSTWQLKHHISLDRIGITKAMKRGAGKRYDVSRFYLYSVLSLVEAEEENDLAVVLAIPAEIILFSPKLNLTKTLCTLPRTGKEDDRCNVFSYTWMNAHTLIPSFSVF